MLQKPKAKKEKGFTLIEVMIVVTIMAILGAIGVPQFLAYRTRSYNTAAKSVVHNLGGDQANLNAEVGIYGHTENGPRFLDDNDSDANAGVISNVCGLVADTRANPFMRRPAMVKNTNINGARLVATTDRTVAMTFRTHAIGISLGDNMIVQAQDIMDAGKQSTFIITARHFKGNTAYGIDSDIKNALYIVSNDNWPYDTLIGLGAAAPPPTLPAPGADPDDFAPHGVPAPGGGKPLGTWSILR